jgi:hypothetical protein
MQMRHQVFFSCLLGKLNFKMSYFPLIRVYYHILNFANFLVLNAWSSMLEKEQAKI